MEHHSFAQLLGSYGEFVGAIGVVITLFYLALQIHRNTQTTRAATFDAILAQWREHVRDTFTTHPTNLDVLRKGLTDFEALDASEKARFTFIVTEEMLFAENMIQQYERGNISVEQLRPWLDHFAQELRTEGARSSGRWFHET